MLLYLIYLNLTKIQIRLLYFRIRRVSYKSLNIKDSSLNFSAKMLKRLGPFYDFNFPVPLDIVPLSLVIIVEPELTLQLAEGHDQVSAKELQLHPPLL